VKWSHPWRVLAPRLGLDPCAPAGGPLCVRVTFGILPAMRESLPRLKAVRLRTWAIVAAALTIGGLAGLLISTHKTVTLIVNGQPPVEVQTYAGRVKGALRSAGIDLRPMDDVTPPAEERIVGGDVIHLKQAYWLSIQAGEARFEVATTADTAAGILSEAGFALFPGDRVWIDGALVEVLEAGLDRHPAQIRLERAVPIYVQMDGHIQEYRSAAPTLGEALWENDVRLYDGDVLRPSPGSPLVEAMEVVLERSSPLIVAADGAHYRAQVVGGTVGDALLEMGMPLTGLDYTKPSLGGRIPPGRRIEIVRRTEQVWIEQEPLPFETLVQADPDLEIDNQRLLSPGAYGIRARQVRVRFENGEEVGRVQDEEWVAREADPRLIGYGTRIVIRSKGTPDGTIEYWRAVVMHATSYSPCRVGGDSCSHTTATGDRLRKGVAAVSVRWFPYMVGARIYVPGYGFATILDNGGGGPWARWIDLGYSDSNFEPWSQDVTVYFLTPVPSNILYILN
jgi:uncharacterized protein YabE (DUF348 family)